MVSMTHDAIRFEEGEFGTRGILTAPWSSDAHEEIMRVRPDELELNTSKGWFGSDLGFVKNYEWIRSFIIIDMKISDISPVMNLRNLTNLKIVTYCRTKLNFSLFPNLKKCALEWRSGAESLFDCVALTHLFVNRYKGKSSLPFGRLANLESLAILNSSITELHGLAELHHLRSLRLGGLRSLKSLDGIEGLCRLESFEMQTCRSVKSLSPLSGLTALVEVNVSDNGQLDSLAPLRRLPHLRTVLFYESTDVVDGDLRTIFENPAISKVSFQNRRHYSHKREDFACCDQG
jgi:hypothetical protein